MKDFLFGQDPSTGQLILGTLTVAFWVFGAAYIAWYAMSALRRSDRWAQLQASLDRLHADPRPVSGPLRWLHLQLLVARGRRRLRKAGSGHPLDILPQPSARRRPLRAARSRRKLLSYPAVRTGFELAARHAPRVSWRQVPARKLAEWRVGCAALDLAEEGAALSDVCVPELMERSGADLQTVFAVMDRLAAELGGRPGGGTPGAETANH